MRDLLNKTVNVIIYAKIGSRNPAKGFFYAVNYGRLSENEAVEVYILGQYEPLEKFTGKVIAIIKREEGAKYILVVSDVGDNYTFKQIRALIEFQERFYSSTVYTAGNFFNKAIGFKALGVVYRDDEILVEKYYDIIKNQIFYRFLGGGIQFREKSEIALAREFKEEINSSIRIVSHKATIENIFDFGDSEEHELVIVYEVKIDKRFYKLDKFLKIENKEKAEVLWIKKKLFIDGELVLYPTGILKYI